MPARASEKTEVPRGRAIAARIEIVLLYCFLLGVPIAFTASNYYALKQERDIRRTLTDLSDKVADAFAEQKRDCSDFVRSSMLRGDLEELRAGTLTRAAIESSDAAAKELLSRLSASFDRISVATFTVPSTGTVGRVVFSAPVEILSPVGARHAVPLRDSNSERAAAVLRLLESEYADYFCREGAQPQIMLVEGVPYINSVASALMGQNGVLLIAQQSAARLKARFEGEQRGLQVVCLKRASAATDLQVLDTTFLTPYGDTIVDVFQRSKSLLTLVTQEPNTMLRHVYDEVYYLQFFPLGDTERLGLVQFLLPMDRSALDRVERAVNAIVLGMLICASVLFIHLAFALKQFGMKLTRRFVVIFLLATLLPILVFRFAKLLYYDKSREIQGDVVDVNTDTQMVFQQYLEELQKVAERLASEPIGTASEKSLPAGKAGMEQRVAQLLGGTQDSEALSGAYFLVREVDLRRGEQRSIASSDAERFVKTEKVPVPAHETFGNFYRRGKVLVFEACSRRVIEGGLREAIVGRTIDESLMRQVHRLKAFDIGIVLGNREYLNGSKGGDLNFSISGLQAEGIQEMNSFLFYRNSQKGIPYTLNYARLYGSTSWHPDVAQKRLGWLAVAINRQEYYRYFKQRDNNVVSGVMLLIAIALTAGYSLTRDMISPLNEIIRRAAQVEKGDFDVAISVRAKDEFQDLIESFNAMTKGLRERELIRNAFHLYVSSQVAEEILRKGRIDAFAEGMRCEVTALFADIRGFTRYAEQHAPRDVIETLNQYFEKIVDVIVEQEGRLDKFIGDGVMATFGDLMQHDDDPLRAVMTAVRIREEVEKINRLRAQRGQETIHFGMGINTGEAVAGNIGSQLHSELSVIGDAVNQASRLQDAAARDEILISEATYLRVKDFVVVSEPEQIRVKGKPEPLTVYKVLDLKRRTTAI